MDEILRAWARQVLQLPFRWRVLLAPTRRRPRRAIVAAGAKREDLIHQVEGRVHRARVRIRAKIAVAVAPEVAHAIDAREVFGEGHLDIGIVFVVAQTHIVSGLVALDVLVFEDQRLDLATHDDVFDVGDFGHQRPILRTQISGIAEIGADARIERGGLAHVEHQALRILVQIDAGLMRKRVEHRLECFGEFGHC